MNVSVPKKGTIEIAEGSFSGSAPIYYYYYTYNPNVTNWLLTKMITFEKKITADGIIPPEVQISYNDGISKIDGGIIPKENAVVEQADERIDRYKGVFDSLYLLLSSAYKNKKLNIYDDSNISIYTIAEIIANVPIEKGNLTQVNDLAYFLSLTKNGSLSAVYILEKVLKKFPERIVAYLNIADAYYNLKSVAVSNKYYLKYIEFMKKNGKEKKIPKRVLKRVEE